MMNDTQVARMVCVECQIACQSFGKHRNGLRRFRCPACKRTFTEQHERTLGGMYISQERAVVALQLLLEGNSIRSTERITGMDRNTVMSLLVKAGECCEALLRERIADLKVCDVEVDEVWGFVFKKQGHIGPNDAAAFMGDAYCFIGMERNTKLVLAYHLGRRDRNHTEQFLEKLGRATSRDRYQLSTDGFQAYNAALPVKLWNRVDYGQIIKVYGASREGQQRYSAPEVISVDRVAVIGRPKANRICTSHIERHNLSIRMGMRRMTRLTNAFSKKWSNLEAAYALWFAYYNFVRVHSSLRVTPAMAQGITDHVWTIRELIGGQC